MNVAVSESGQMASPPAMHEQERPPPPPLDNMSYGDCLEVKREYYQNCSVLGCVLSYSVVVWLIT